MDSSNFAYERAYNLKAHQKKLKEIQKSPTKRLDNKLPEIFLNKRKNKGYDRIWRDFVVNKENVLLLNKLIEIKSKQRHSTKIESPRLDKSEKIEVEKRPTDISISSAKTIPKRFKAVQNERKSVPRKQHKLDPL